MIGDEASQLRSMLDVTYPMENGIVRFVFWELFKFYINLNYLEKKMYF